ncbi:MAG: helix-turn-helix domain-containing protein [Acutalibacter sp.]
MLCYTESMSEQLEKLEKTAKRDGFKGERVIILPTEAFKDFTQHPLVRRLYLTDVGFYPRAQDHYRERKDGIEEYILIYCTEGRGVIQVEGREYDLGENQAFCIPRWRGHRYWACGDAPWSILWVHFKGEDTAYYPLEEERLVSLQGLHEENQMMFLFDLLFHALEGDYVLGNFIYMSQVLSLVLGELYHRDRGAGVGGGQVTGIIRYMVRHLGESLTLEELSQEFDMSKSSLNALFQRQTGRSPMDFFIRLKMKEACKMLRSSGLRVNEVARQVGYQDPYYFSRLFHKVVGISPREYQQSEYFHFQD